MELRTLRYFVAVAEAQNISRAAQGLRFSQPALSRQIKSLEGEVGASLFLRHANAVTLTPEGRQLLPKAQDILRRADEAVASVRSISSKPVVRVAYASTLAGELVAAAMKRLGRSDSHLVVELIDVSSAEMYRGLFRGSIDVIVTVSSGLDRGIRWQRLREAGVSVLLPRGHPLARGKQLSWPSIAAEPWLIFSRKEYPEFWQHLRPWFRKQKIKPVIAGEFDGINTLCTAASAGLGIGLVNDQVRPPRGLVLRPLAPQPVVTWIAAGTSGRVRQRAPVTAFLKAICVSAAQNRK